MSIYALVAAFAVTAGPPVVVAFGDSTTAARANTRVYAERLPEDLAQQGLEIQVINAGLPNHTTEQARALFGPDVLDHQPAVVVIQFGINDAAVDVWKAEPATRPRVAVERYADHLRFFVRTLRAQGSRPILMTPNPLRWCSHTRQRFGKPPYRPDDSDGLNLFLSAYAEAMRSVARREQVPLVDIAAAFKGRNDIDDLLDDGVHPNSAGHRLVAQLLLPLVAAQLAAEPTPTVKRPALTITHGPLLGRPGPQQMGIWARTNRPGAFRIHYGTKPEKLDRSAGPVETRADADCSGWVLLEQLEPNRRYHYRVVAEGMSAASGPGGSFQTWPLSSALRDPQHNPRGLWNLRFEVGCCANQAGTSLGPTLPLYQTMLPRHREGLHFGIFNGDFIYEEAREFAPADWKQQTGQSDEPAVLRLSPPVAGVWENYKLYLHRGKPLAEWHRHVPTYFTFDDHEILNDVIGCGEIGLRDRRTVFRDPAVKAWQDYVGWANPTTFSQPIQFGRGALKAGSDLLTDSAADFRKLDLKQSANLHIHWGTPDAGVNEALLDGVGGDPNAGVYEIVEIVDPQRLRVRPAAKATGESTYSIGQRSYYRWQAANCEFFAVDTRSHRTKHNAAAPEKPGPTLLGREQLNWLKTSTAASQADFLFIVSSVPFIIPHNGAGGMAPQADDKDDAWTAFLAERDDLIQHLDRLGKPTFVLTGDLHNSFVIRASDHVWEMCCGPHNSTNHPLGSEGDRPANGPFTWRGRRSDIRWSTFFLDDVPRKLRAQPVYTIVQVNNVANSPLTANESRWVAYPRPHVVFQFYDGLTGDLLYAESIAATRSR